MTVQAAAEAAGEYACPLVEITSGEPLLQKDTPALAGALIRSGKTVLVETNGTLPVTALPEEAIRIMDIKCPGSGASEKTDWSNIRHLRQTDNVKFVLTGRPDYDWAGRIISQYRLADRAAVLLSPVEPALTCADLAAWILADHLPVRLQPQLHKWIWPDEQKGR